MAASTTYFALTSPAVFSSITPPIAAGTSTSQSTFRISLLSIAAPPAKSASLPPAATCALSALTSSPASLCVAPNASLTATTRPFSSSKSSAAQAPTLPNPWIA